MTSVRTSTSKPFALLTSIPSEQAWRPAVDPSDILVKPEPGDLLPRLARMRKAETVVVDFETRGTRAWHPDDRPVGIGCAWAGPDGVEAFYLDLSDPRRADVLALLSALGETGGLVAHNVLFDAQFLDRLSRDYCGQPFPWKWTHCTYGLLRALATEDFEGQSWGLKAAQVDLLGWSETNERELKKWLIENGHTKRPIRKELREKLFRVEAAPQSEPAGSGERLLHAWPDPHVHVLHVEGNEAAVPEP